MKVAIIQARMGSQRLPGKVLADIAGQPMLQRLVRRVRQSQTIDRIVVATTGQPEDDDIARFCRRHPIEFFRGHESDVLDRYYQVAKAFDADIVARITADCPLIDAQLLDEVVSVIDRSDQQLDYACNFYPDRTFPRGLDVEAFSFETLHRVWQTATLPYHREHVTAAIYENPTQYCLGSIAQTVNYSDYRWTVDTPEDLELVRAIYRHFGDAEFTWTDVIQAYQKNCEWFSINNLVQQKKAAA